MAVADYNHLPASKEHTHLSFLILQTVTSKVFNATVANFFFRQSHDR